jgi:signal transduction histidine kinase
MKRYLLGEGLPGSLDPNTHAVHLDEKGPTEVAHAAKAFNAMPARIAAYLKERMQLLAAIFHDLQTPTAVIQ